MTTEEIKEILKTRIAVYKAGVECGAWDALKESDVKAMTNYLFPKSGFIAFYNLIMAYMRKFHSDIQGEAYYLFKLSAQIEREILEYLKKNPTDITAIVDDAKAYLKERDTIISEGSLIPSSVGSLRDNSIDDILRLFAKQYRYSFERNLAVYPYCD